MSVKEFNIIKHDNIIGKYLISIGQQSSYSRNSIVIDRVPSITWIPGTNFGRNYSEFREIPCDSASTQFLEFRTEIRYLSLRLIFNYNSRRDGEGG
jgi:hypothetical protein